MVEICFFANGTNHSELKKMLKENDVPVSSWYDNFVYNAIKECGLVLHSIRCLIV